MSEQSSVERIRAIVYGLYEDAERAIDEIRDIAQEEAERNPESAIGWQSFGLIESAEAMKQFRFATRFLVGGLEWHKLVPTGGSQSTGGPY